jgi:diguanylate cyclase (GGDEF)-like protein
MEAGAQPAVLLALPPQRAAAAASALEAADLRPVVASLANEVLDTLYSQPPHCLVLPIGMAGPHGNRLLDELKSDNLYGHLPVIVVVSEAELAAGIDWRRVLADDYVMEAFSDAELISRVRLCLARAQRDLHANPLTGLPGNVTIMQEAEQRLAEGEAFAMAYLDIDHFKAFNDKYGFGRGDEVLRMTARVLLNAVRALKDPMAYVGHVGGDDFIFMVSADRAVQACQDVLRHFDLIVPNFYDEEDRINGSIHSVDRQGNPHTYPLMSCSIAVIDTARSDPRHVGEIVSRAAQVKKFAKDLPGSNFVIDRRA